MNRGYVRYADLILDYLVWNTPVLFDQDPHVNYCGGYRDYRSILRRIFASGVWTSLGLTSLMCMVNFWLIYVGHAHRRWQRDGGDVLPSPNLHATEGWPY